MNGEIDELLKKYGTSLEETRELLPKLTEAIEKQKALAFPTAPQFFTAEEARQFGVELEPDWTLKLTPGKDGLEPSISFITPEKWEITQAEEYISPEGKKYTKEELELELAAPEIPLEVEQVFGKVFPGRGVEDVLAYAETQPEAFYSDIFEIGRTPETEEFLKTLFPEITAGEIEEFFAPMPLTTMAVEAFKATEWFAPPAEWGEVVKGPMDILKWLAPTKLGAGLGVLGAYLEKYVGRPWEVAILEANARVHDLGILAPPITELDKEVIRRLDELQGKYGWGMIFAEEVSEVWEYQFKNLPPEVQWQKTYFEWMNLAYWVPIGGAFGKAAQLTSKIPLIGRGVRITAAGVQAIEKGITYPLVKPLELGAKGAERLGVRIGESLANKLIKETDNLLLEIPESGRILDGVLVDNWMKRTLELASKIPAIKAGIEKGLGWRILAKREGQAVEDIVSRAAVVYAEVRRMGLNAKAPKLWELRAIEMNPVKYFGFNNKAFSSKMFNRLLPEYKGLAEGGTLEHVFTKPEMYSWQGMDKGLEYVTRVHEINTEVLNLLKKEGVAPEGLLEDWWLHRVVEGKFNAEEELIALRGRPGVKGGRIGAKPSFEMHRKAPTMAEGIAWGVQYDRNPEVAITSYIEEAFKKIADERVVKYLEPFGVLPAERLAERFPEVVERAALTKTELADAAHFGSVINRAIRGEKIPTQTLAALERRFPELGQRFRALAQEPAVAEKQLREILAQNQNVIRSLQKRLEKAEAIDIQALTAQAKAEAIAEARLAVPDDFKLREAFGLMEYEDRLAFRSTMQGQLDDIGRMSMEQEGELAGLRESLSIDPVATAKFTIGTKIVGRGATKKVVPNQVTLESFISIREQNFPEYFTLKQAEALYPRGNFTRYTQKGLKTYNRVPRDVALDDLTKQFKMSADEIADRVMAIRADRQTIKDLEFLVGMSDSRYKGIKRMLGILDDVETKPEFVLKPKPVEAPVEDVKVGDVFVNEKGRRFTATKWRPLLEADVLFGKPKAGLEGKWVLKDQRGRVVHLSLDELAERGYKKEIIAKAEAGMPEAGVQKDIFGYETPVFPKGKGQVTQISMEDYAKLVETWKKAGLPEDSLPAAIKPKIEGVKGLEAEAQAVKVTYELPAVKSATERTAGLEALRNEVKAITEARKAPYWQARSERAFRMEQVRQPGIGEGYIMQPFAGGRIYTQEFIDAFNKFFGHEAGLGVLRVTSDIAGILRITKAALDFSQPAIQGLPSWGLAHAYLLFNPPVGLKLMGAWYKTFVQSTAAFFHPEILARALTKLEGPTMQRIAYGGSAHAVDYFQTLWARGGLAGLAEKGMAKIPFKPYHRAEITFFGAGELVRDRFWRILSPKAIARGQEFELARLLDRFTGITDAASLGVPLTTRQLEQTFVWFAPNYTRACLTVLADIFRGGMTGAETRKALAGMIAAGSAMYSAIQYGIATMDGKSHEDAWESVEEGFCISKDPITHEVEWKPSARFMTMKIGNYYFGFGGFWYGLLRLGGNIMACINEVGDRERIDLVRLLKHGGLNKQDNPFIYWWFSRASPFFGAGFELATGKDFLGYPIETQAEYTEYVITRFEPIWMEQGLNWMIPGLAREHEIPEGMARAALVPAEIFGLRTFPESTWVDFYDKVNEYIQRIPREELDPKQIGAWEAGELEWQHLTELQKANLLSRYPDLQELYGEAQADSAVRDSPHWKAWQGRIEEERGIYYKRIEELTGQLLKGEIDTREYREKAGEAGMNYGSILEAMERDPNYAEIYDYFDKKEAEDKYGFRDDLALAEYQSAIIYAEDLIDSKGDYNWDERDRRIDAFIEKWGQGAYDRIQQYLQQEKGLKDLNEVWIRKASDTEKLGRGYWRLPYKPIIEMDVDDEAEGNIPTEYYTLWKAYQALETDADREAFIDNHPDLAKDWRAEYRKANPEEDARLALWGYGGKLQSREAYDLVEQWSRKLGIPLEQMGLGLPPRTLIEPYFEYADLILKYSPLSAEAKLFRLENPEFNNWAMENWGWGSTIDFKGMNYYKLQIKNSSFEAEYQAFGDKTSPAYIEDDKERALAREKFLETHPEFRDDRRRLEAMDLELGDWDEWQVNTYVEYYSVKRTGYEDDWFLMEHKEFYDVMVEEGIWQPRDFSTVPSREVYALLENYLKVSKGQERLVYRHKHPELEEWLVKVKGYTPVGDRWMNGKQNGKEKKEPEAHWEEAQEAMKIKEFIEKF